MFDPPYQTVLKPYGQALLALARRNAKVVCLGADLTRQTETDMFRDAIGERFINAGVAEANMIGIAAGLARAGHIVFVNTFGVFCTRRCYDQIAMAVAYPRLNVKLVGFMPGLSSPGGPSHQAIEDVALMRALPNMTVVEPADALEVVQAVDLIADHPGPVYMRLKRGETPMIFEADHRLDLARAQNSSWRRRRRCVDHRCRHDDSRCARRGARTGGERRGRHGRQRASHKAAGHADGRCRSAPEPKSSSRRRTIR